MRIVLDASVALTWAFSDEGSEYSARVLEACRHIDALVPGVWPSEICNALLVAERRKRLTKAEAVAFADLLEGLKPVVDPAALHHVLAYVVPITRGYQLSVYDASYLELAAREQAQLATVDRRLRNAAQGIGARLFE